jgi:PadR family transcriptional regulator, regulatory protein PadR
VIKELFLGFIRVHILYHASKEPVYGLWLIEELSQHGYKLSPGTLYPILHKLDREGGLKSFSKLVDGKIRKYYQITSKGKKNMAEAKEKVKGLIEEINE